eukprot:1150391-Pelagomonas_calceolata.AAC.5
MLCNCGPPSDACQQVTSFRAGNERGHPADAVIHLPSKMLMQECYVTADFQVMSACRPHDGIGGEKGCKGMQGSHQLANKGTGGARQGCSDCTGDAVRSDEDAEQHGGCNMSSAEALEQ